MDVPKLWTEISLVKKVQERNKAGEKFWLLDGPPYPNAPAHLGHVRGVTIKDMFLKMKAMQGRRIWIKPGFDTHGLPIENKVEKELGIVNKEDIEKMGVKEFMKRCRDFATSNVEEWMEFYRQMGVWFGWEEPYATLQKSYMDSVWWSVSELWGKGLLKQGEKPFYWCPHCQTVLSGYEVTDEYKELEDPSIFVKFKTDEGFSLLAWTTTPWTLPGNTGLVVREDAQYVKVNVDGEKIVLAKERLCSLDELGKKYKVIEEFSGKKLKGIHYHPAVQCGAQKSIDKVKNARIVCFSLPVIKQKVSGKVASKKEVEDETLVEHFTNLSDGTGIVHCAPGHGPEDFDIGKEYGLPVLSPVDDAGRFTADVGEFAGKKVRETNGEIVKYLEAHGSLLGMQKIKHRYPVCWRCKTPLVFRLTEQWLLDIEQIKEKLVNAAKKVKWMPEFAKERMIHWLSNAKDWTLSRQRYWNIPLPVWKCAKGHIKVVGSAGELEKLGGKKVNDLHRDVVDNIHFPCPECKSGMSRVKDVLDVWYDSGAASFAVPGVNTQLFKSVWPMDRIDEGQDQIRGWFYTLLVLGVALFGESPYKAVSMHGWVVDEKGEKMSKSKGNFVTGKQALEDLGADILRFYILWEASPSDIIRFSPARAKKEIGKMFFIWKNLHSYLLKFSGGASEAGELRIEDKWIISKFNSLVKGFLKDIGDYNPHHATRRIFTFLVEDLSRKYMKLAKERVREDDLVPLGVMKKIHESLLKLVAPISPFFAESLHREISKSESIFLEKYPVADESRINAKLEEEFDGAFGIIEAVLSFRDARGIGLKYPLRKISVSGKKLGAFEGLIKSLANVKEIGSCKGDEVEAGDLRVCIDPAQGDAEIGEGYMREVSRRVQELRKKKGLLQKDKVRVFVWGDEKLVNAVKSFRDEFAFRTGAEEVQFREGGEIREAWDIKGMKLGAGI